MTEAHPCQAGGAGSPMYLGTGSGWSHTCSEAPRPTQDPSAMPSTCFQHREAPALGPLPYTCGRSQHTGSMPRVPSQPCPQPLCYGCQVRADLPGPFLQGLPGLAHLRARPGKQLPGRPFLSDRVRPAGSVHRARPPGSPWPSSPAAGSLLDVPLWPQLWYGVPTPWGLPRASEGGGQGGARRLGGRDAPAGLRSAKGGQPTWAPLCSGEPHLPGLDSGMTRGKWRREGLRGLCGQRWGE